ncbi:mitochondrial 37S ribosomal protein uS2m [Lodderomyces beijingensis]|uniref:Ribosomal protein S2 n=1 Tax=Lodderomyces beijingensis TaxID=1775926 RepID=A0ABP0ZP78_9ASCO
MKRILCGTPSPLGRSFSRSCVKLNAQEAQAKIMEHKLSNKELREQAIADALAREEEAIKKAKEIRELTAQSQGLIGTLNKTPTELVNERIRQLNRSLAKLPEEKVKQLDEELRDFIIKNMQLPQDIVADRPWAQAKSSQRVSRTGEGTTTATTTRSPESNEFISQYPNLKPTPDYKSYSEQELYIRQLNYLRTTGSLGSKLSDIYKPQRDTTHPAKISETSLNTLLAAGCHLGHATASFRASFQPFLYGVYNGIHIIDLNQTLKQLKVACKVIEGVSEKGGIILFVGTHKNWSIQQSLVAASERSSAYYVSKRWIPGTITNYIEVTSQIKDPQSRHRADMTNKIVESGKYIPQSVIKPDLVVVLNPVENRNCIKECIASCIPTIALCDTDMEPSLVTYPVPCNDDNARSVNLMLGIMSRAAEAGLKTRLNVIKELKEAERQRRANELAIQAKREAEEERDAKIAFADLGVDTVAA